MIFNMVKFTMLATVVSVLTFSSSMSQAALDNKGTEFILAFLPNAQSGEITELHLTGDVATNVTVEYPVNSPTFSTTAAVTPGNVTIVMIPATAATLWSPNTVANNAVRASSDDEFVAYLINRASVSSDAALGLPVDVMNTEYIVADYVASGSFSWFSEFIVYAAFDATTATITPTAGLVGRAAGVPFDVTLNRGEGILLRAASSAAGVTLTGTTVTADRPVGVVNGNEAVQVPPGTSFGDHVFEVAQPVQTWGDEILVANLPQRTGGSIYRVLASQDGTTVTQDGVFLTSLNRGDFFETPFLAGNHSFAGDKPIYVVQYMPGDGASGATGGDPAMGNMIPFAQYQSNYTFSTVGGSQFAQNYVTIIAEDADAGTITLDGAPIGAGSFSTIGTSGFSAAVLLLSEGPHTTSSNGVHGITVEGFNAADSYIYPGGALFEFINPAGDANPPICTATVNDGPPPFVEGAAEDNRPSEDVNGNGELDAGEDLNGNGQIDKDTGIFFVDLQPGASNIDLLVDPFVPGDGMITYTVELIDPGMSGNGVVQVTDGAGNICDEPIDLQVDDGGLVCDADGNGQVDINDIRAIMAARNTPASGPDDPRDADGNGVINANDARQCVLQCTNSRCAP